MRRLRFIVLFSGLAFLVYGQQIGNYVSNGSFEEIYSCSGPLFPLGVVKYWSSIDSTSYGAEYFSKCNNRVPLNGNTYQFPYKGNSHIITNFFCPNFCTRGYPRNRLKTSLLVGRKYCVKFFVNIANTSPFGIDGFGAYFGGNSIDTITNCHMLNYLVPQIQNSIGNVITDTLNWVPITGTFTAVGNEKYMVLGNFLSDNAVTTASIGGPYYPQLWTDLMLDYVSCIDVDLPAYAGPNKNIYAGDSVYIGRESDVEIDESCIWYLMTSPTTSVAIDTIAGLWVKPASTSTYIVQQQIWCSSVKWDTVVVFLDAVGLQDIKWYSDHINLFPNPTSDNITISISMANPDIRGFSLVNNLGQTIREGDINLKDKSITLQTSDLDPGIYQVHFKTSVGTVTKQFVKN